MQAGAIVIGDFRIRRFFAVTFVAFGIVLVIGLVIRSRNAVNESKRAIARIELSELRNGLIRYYQDNGRFPNTEEGLGALVPSLRLAPDGVDPEILHPSPMRSRPLIDPWGHPFEYQSDGNSYFLKSLGPGGTESDSHRDFNLSITGP